MSLLTFREIQRQVQAKIQNTGTSVSNENDLLPKIKDWINSRYARIYRSFPWAASIESYNLTLTASQAEYAFDRDAERIIKIFDTTNAKVIQPDSLENHFREYADELDKSGNIIRDNPARYRPVGIFTVKAEVGDTAETVDIVSTDNTTDIAPNCVHIEGLVSGVEIGEDVTLTGTSSATSTNTYDANQKLRISIGTTSGVRKTVVGKVTVDGTTSGTDFSIIAPSQQAAQYMWFRVSPQPKTTGTQPTWEVWYKKNHKRMDDNNDIPIVDCCIELVEGVFADALREDGMEQEAQLAEQKHITMVKELQAVQSNRGTIEQFKPTNRSGTTSTIDPYLWIP